MKRRDLRKSAGTARQILAAVAGLVILTFAVFGRAVGHEFVGLDDDSYILRNDWIHPGLTRAGIEWAFTTFREANWHPLTWVSHMIDCSLFGLDPAGHHLTSVVLHAANAALLFLALRALTREFWPSAVVAALFALHPLRVESVAWVSERKDVLAACFFMLALLAYARYARAPSHGRLALVGAAFAAGLMAKPMLVSLPLVLLLLDVWPLRRIGKPAGGGPAGTGPVSLIVEKAPLAALALASCAVTVFAQAGSGAASSLLQIPMGIRLVNALGSLGEYAVDLVWPRGLAAFYPHPALVPGGTSALVTSAVTGAFVVGAFAAAAWTYRITRPYLAVGLAWYLVTLVPVIGIFQVGTQARADRYTYLPAIGILIAVVWTGRDWIAAKPRWRTALACASVLALIVYATLAFFQTGTWRDSPTLFEHALAVTRENFVAHNNLGSYLVDQGDRAADAGQAGAAERHFDGARGHFEAALQIRPGYALAHGNLGIVLERYDDPAGAEREYREAIHLSPRLADAMCNLGNLLLERGDANAAVLEFRRALGVHPDDVEARKALGLALARSGDLDEGIREMERVLVADPDDAKVLNSLGVAYALRGNAPEAAQRFERALLADPALAEAHSNLGRLLAAGGRSADAERRYREALRLAPDFFDARFNLAILLKRRGDPEGARAELGVAARLRPGDPRVEAELRSLGGGP